MALAEDLTSDVRRIFATAWELRDGIVVPETEDLQLGNDAVKLKAAVLYADLVESTKLVHTKLPAFAAEVYKTYLLCVSKIIRAEGGEITAFDGDRVMGVFVGDSKCSAAVRVALKTNYCLDNIINPALKLQYKDSDYAVRHAVGVDVSELLVARTGVRGANDLVWVGSAANVAAKLSGLRGEPYSCWLTEAVYGKANREAKYSKGKPMWSKRYWEERDVQVYGSNWTWSI